MKTGIVKASTIAKHGRMDAEFYLRRVQILDSDRTVIRSSKNLRCIGEHARGNLVRHVSIRKYDPTVPAEIQASMPKGTEAELYILWEDGSFVQTYFSDFTVLKQWVRDRRFLRDALLYVNGAGAGRVTKGNPA